ncbi:MAG: hypothetical protein ACAH80_01525 [Alphaproteobacteria bacterium]
MKRFLVLVLAIMLIAAPAFAELRSTGTPNITRGPTDVPAGNLGGGLPQQNIPQNSLSDSAAEQQKKMEEIQRIAKCQKNCKKSATDGANHAVPYCMNGICSPNYKPKWQEKFDLINKMCRKQNKCE